LLCILILTLYTKLHPFLVLLGVTVVYGSVTAIDVTTAIQALKNGFGEFAGEIGIVIASAMIIGTFMAQTGALDKLARGMFKITGSKNVAAVMCFVGFITGSIVDAPTGFTIFRVVRQTLLVMELLQLLAHLWL
jgi:GntP family gluconate:H+ symporter